MTEYITSGRQIAGPIDYKRSYCKGCQVRMTIGKPNPNGSWASRLELDQNIINLLLMAAAEFDAIAASYGDHTNAVEFVDWMSVDALRSGVNDAPHWDGAPPRNLSGEITARGHDVAHRHPDPIPYAPIRRTRP